MRISCGFARKPRAIEIARGRRNSLLAEIGLHGLPQLGELLALLVAQRSHVEKPLLHPGLAHDDAIEGVGGQLGIGGVVTYKKTNLREILTEVGLSKVVLETDSPYLTPVPFRGKRNESSYLKYVVEKIAEVKEMPVEEAARLTTENAKKIFGA